MQERERQERDRVIAVARSYLRTPYVDCAKVKGAGVDCATLVAMVFEEAGLEHNLPMPKYSPQWYLHRSEEVYLKSILKYCREIDQAAAKPADIVLYQFGRCYSHGAIIVDPGFPTIIHAYKQAQTVTLGEGDGGDLSRRKRRFFQRRAWGAD